MTTISALISALLETAFGSLIRLWKAGFRILEFFKKALGLLFVAGLVGFCLCNLYWLVVSGLVFRLARRQRSGWIGFEEAPLAFITWSILYSTPILVAALAVFAFISQRREHQRATFRHFADGIGPPPIVEVMDPPDGARRRPVNRKGDKPQDVDAAQ